MCRRVLGRFLAMAAKGCAAALPLGAVGRDVSWFCVLFVELLAVARVAQWFREEKWFRAGVPNLAFAAGQEQSERWRCIVAFGFGFEFDSVFLGLVIQHALGFFIQCYGLLVSICIGNSCACCSCACALQQGCSTLG